MRVKSATGTVQQKRRVIRPHQSKIKRVNKILYKGSSIRDEENRDELNWDELSWLQQSFVASREAMCKLQTS